MEILYLLLRTLAFALLFYGIISLIDVFLKEAEQRDKEILKYKEEEEAFISDAKSTLQEKLDKEPLELSKRRIKREHEQWLEGRITSFNYYLERESEKKKAIILMSLFFGFFGALFSMYWW